MPETHSGELSANAFTEWLPGEIEIRIGLERQHDRWYALMLDYNVAGMGHTQREAVADAARLLVRHLALSCEKGLTFPEAARPVPRHIENAYNPAGSLWGRMRRSTGRRLKKRPLSRVLALGEPLHSS
jgi:hypothetical protein